MAVNCDGRSIISTDRRAPSELRKCRRLARLSTRSRKLGLESGANWHKLSVSLTEKYGHSCTSKRDGASSTSSNSRLTIGSTLIAAGLRHFSPSALRRVLLPAISLGYVSPRSPARGIPAESTDYKANS